MALTIDIDSYNDKLPSSISSDAQVMSFGNVQDIQLQALLPFIDQVRVLCNIPALNEDTLDLLAFQFQVLFYSGTELITDDVARLAAKRSLIANSFDFHSRLGTKEVLQEILVTIYSNAYVQEWFEYGGTPHHFRVLTDNVINDPAIVTSITGVVGIVKRASSWFEGFYTVQRAPAALLNIFTCIYAQTFIQAPLALSITPGALPSRYIQNINSGVPAGSNQFQTVVFSLAQTAGNLNVVVLTFSDASPALTATVDSVVDSAGNTYTAAIPLFSRYNAAAGVTLGLAVYYAPNIVNSNVGDNTVTVTLTGSEPNFAIDAFEYFGPDLVAPLDRTRTNSGDIQTTTAMTSLVASATTFPNEVVLGIGASLTGVSAEGSGFNLKDKFFLLIVEDMIVSATGAYTATATSNAGSGPWLMAIATFK